MNQKKKVKVGYQGQPGAFSVVAGHQLLADIEDMDNIEFVPFQTFDQLFRELDNTDLSGAVVAIENTLVGSVREGNIENYERLLEYQPAILRETVVHVVHNLIALPGVTLSDIRRVYSHPMALLQCQQFLQEHAEQLEAVAHTDTAGSVKKVIEEKLTDVAAIASELAAEIYGGNILLKNIGDNDENYTRFFLLGSRTSHEKGKWRRSGNKTSIVFGTKNEAGALARCLDVFAQRNISLTKIESRPIVGKPWEYLFYMDFLGNPNAPAVASTLTELCKAAEFLEILGCYEKWATPRVDGCTNL